MSQQSTRNMTEREFFSQMRAYLSLIWASTESLSVEELADDAGLCPATVRRLYAGDIDLRYVRALTLLKLGAAVGLGDLWLNVMAQHTEAHRPRVAA